MNQKLLALASSIALVCGAAACFPSVPVAKEAADTGPLERDVKAATEKMKDLEGKLDDGQKKLGAKMFPDELAMVLGGINVPFDASNLEGKRVGHLPNRVLRSLLAFTSGAEGLNRSKDKLKNLLVVAQAPVVKAWKEEKEPVANFAVVFHAQGDRMVADLLPLKEPFAWNGEPPASFTVVSMQGNKASEKRVKRWVKGDLTGSDPIGLPVDPRTTAPFSSEVLISRLSKAVFELRESLLGSHDDPTHEEPGLLKAGEDLANELHKLSLSH